MYDGTSDDAAVTAVWPIIEGHGWAAVQRLRAAVGW